MKSIEKSYGVNGSYGVNWSDGVNVSYGVNWSDGVNWSCGVNRSDGVNRSYGVINSFGVDKALFLANKKREFTIFGKVVSEQRFNEALGNMSNRLNGWKPEFNNAFQLYIKKGSDWKKVDANEITGTLSDDNVPYEAWKTMPIEAINEIKSWPEFDSEMFMAITGIDCSVNTKKQELIDKANELIAKANELKSQAERI